jgi:predicted nucleic acid-binding protein
VVIVYLDTSSLIKLYVEEEHSAAVRDLSQTATGLLTCRVAYAEARSALARRQRTGDLTDDDYRRIVSQLDVDWEELLVIDFDEHLAGDLAERHAIRGFDAIHLAAALALARDTRTDIDFRFSTFDARLQTAATSEGILPP